MNFWAFCWMVMFLPMFGMTQQLNLMTLLLTWFINTAKKLLDIAPLTCYTGVLSIWKRFKGNSMKEKGGLELFLFGCWLVSSSVFCTLFVNWPIHHCSTCIGSHPLAFQLLQCCPDSSTCGNSTPTPQSNECCCSHCPGLPAIWSRLYCNVLRPILAAIATAHAIQTLPPDTSATG
jgi:hypothetical protein